MTFNTRLMVTPGQVSGPPRISLTKLLGGHNFHLRVQKVQWRPVMDVIERVPLLERIGAHAKQEMRDRLIEHTHHIRKYGDDLPEIRDWKWPY